MSCDHTIRPAHDTDSFSVWVVELILIEDVMYLFIDNLSKTTCMQ